MPTNPEALIERAVDSAYDVLVLGSRVPAMYEPRAGAFFAAQGAARAYLAKRDRDGLTPLELLDPADADWVLAAMRTEATHAMRAWYSNDSATRAEQHRLSTHAVRWVLQFHRGMVPFARTDALVAAMHDAAQRTVQTQAWDTTDELYERMVAEATNVLTSMAAPIED